MHPSLHSMKRWLNVCFSDVQYGYKSESFIFILHRVAFVGRMLCKILIWNAISFVSVVDWYGRSWYSILHVAYCIKSLGCVGTCISSWSGMAHIWLTDFLRSVCVCVLFGASKDKQALFWELLERTGCHQLQYLTAEFCEASMIYHNIWIVSPPKISPLT